MQVALYAKTRVWDALLCVIASCALAYTLSSAFHATRPFQESPLVLFGICTLITVVLFAIAFSYRMAVPGSIAFAVAAAVALVLCARASNGEHVMDDVQGNYLISALVLLTCTVAVFILTRRKATTLVLLAAGLLLCVAVEYLYWRGHVLSLALFGLATATLFAYRVYQKSVLSAASDSLSFGGVTAAGAGMVAVSLIAAAAVFVLVIAPMQPSNLVVKLMTKHMRVDQIDVRGTGAVLDVQNLELFSINTNGQIQKGLANDQTQDSEQNTDPTLTTAEQPEENAGSALALDDEGQEESAKVVSLDLPPWALAGAPVLLALLIFAPFAIKRYMRSRAYGRMLQGDPSDTVKQMYPFFVERFSKFGIALPAGSTVRDYASNFASAFSQFERGVQAPAFGVLTAVFERCAYGGVKASEKDRSLFTDYYKAFYKNGRKFVGFLRYLRLYFFV